MPVGKLVIRKNIKNKQIFFASLKSPRKELYPELDPDLLVRGTDPQIQIRICTKMSRIPNNDANSGEYPDQNLSTYLVS